MSMVANAPTVSRNIDVHEISGFENVPPHVTKVPTLIKQDGTMLVGAEVFRYLKKLRQEPSFPQTPEMSERREMFPGLDNVSWEHVLFLFLAILLFVGAYRYWKLSSSVHIPGTYW